MKPRYNNKTHKDFRRSRARQGMQGITKEDQTYELDIHQTGN